MCLAPISIQKCWESFLETKVSNVFKGPSKGFELGIPFPWQGSSATTHGVVASRSPSLLGQRGTLLRFWVNTFSGGPEPLKQRNILLSWPTSKISKKYHTSIRIYHLILQIYTTTKKRWNMVSHHHQFSNLQELPRRLFRPKNESPQRLYSTRTKSNLVRVVKSKSPVSHTDFVHCNRRIPLVSKEFSTMLKFLSWVELIVFDQRREKDHGRLYWYWIICRLQQCVPDTIWSKTF